MGIILDFGLKTEIRHYFSNLRKKSKNRKRD